MALPPPNSGAYWKEYEINTPTYRLSPLEKPDMSPYLVHLTGKNEILGILSEKDGCSGLIKSCVPKDSKSDWYKEKVVCFTESPLFAIDAFRYLRFARWQSDHRFGIGFSKDRLVSSGVRPVLYMDNSRVAQLKKLLDMLPQNPQHGVKLNSKKLLGMIMPLMNVMMENHPKQGFMWEREWRCCDRDGFEFSYDDIEIICCPKEEQEAIAKVLGDKANDIFFVQSWDQYDEVTEFLASRKAGWEDKVKIKDEKLDRLSTLKIQLSQELNKASAYRSYIEKLQGELDALSEYQESLSSQIGKIETEIRSQKARIVIEDSCVGCGVGFDEETGKHLWNDDDQYKDYLCGYCHYQAVIRPMEED
ncbi:hypothetical protein DV711_03035 [Motiliproteus coralliicola]|uniref:Uncharacterized protein n=1 Tax=Motiliproteus coralliicola TaxID=2283196 RepID=A0A369WR68_9GAMM|nr:abortive infection system antitoxin AbiGi family protein [Motiliproteus coralliicola]RDE24580.1 hypothetical protein DV711_03035 [Motiliproteus coralliicola]